MNDSSSPKVILITGGAGYIGSNLVNRLQGLHHTIIVVDDLSSGSTNNLPANVIFFRGAVGDKKFLRDVFRKYSIDLVFHLAAKKSVVESTRNPHIFVETNVEGTRVLLEVMNEFRTTRLVFASTAAVYGDREVRIEGFSELDPPAPSNPYGKSKLMAEQVIGEFVQNSNLQAFVFRFFNVAMSEISLSHSKSEDLLSVLSDCYSEECSFSIFGNDYSTPDGTCYRDFIHISDLLDALQKSISLIYVKTEKITLLNLGSGSTISLGEIARIGSELLHPRFSFVYVDRRPGDVAYSLADISSAVSSLNWQPRVSPSELFESFFEKLKNLSF